MPNVVEILVKVKDATGAGFAQTEKSAAKGGEKAGAAFGNSLNRVTKAGSAAFIGVAALSVKMAGDFQESMTTLVTGAGEAEGNLHMVGEGIKRIATETGTSTKKLIDGMFMIESAGYHGQAGLTVLQAAAQGAKVGNADLGTVANAVTTILNAYGMKAGDAAKATNMMVATVSSGKVKMEDLAGSISKVLPTAAALHIKASEVGGALATMTGQGISAKLSSMGLNAALLALAAPSGIAKKAMDGVGLSSKKVSDTLTHQGLVAALEMVTDAAAKKFPPGSAAYVNAVKDMMGGNRGLQVALALTGGHLDTLKKNVKNVGSAMDEGGNHVRGWDQVQKDFNQRLSVFKERAEVAGITIGEKLIPYVSKMLEFFGRNAAAIVPVVVALGGLMVAARIANAVMILTKAMWGLNAAFAANPVGIILVALAALGVAFYVAWRKSAGFRDAMKNIAIVALDVGVIVVRVAKGIVDSFLNMAGNVIHAAAVAFGWVPGIGDKLRTADKAFQGFRKNVDNVFDGIIGKMEDYKNKLSDSANQSEKSLGRIGDAFSRQGRAAKNAEDDIIKYNQSVRKNGEISTETNKARDSLISDLEKAGVNSQRAREDVRKYTDSIHTNGLTSDATNKARDRLINDIISAWKNSRQGQTDMAKFTNAVRSHSSNSDAVRSARTRLINDLIHAGVDADTARRMVRNMQDQINHMRGKTVNVNVHAGGGGGVRVTPSSGMPGAKDMSVYFKPLAEGGKLPGFGGGDQVPALLEPGETVVDKFRSKKFARVFRAMGVKGYATGGIVGMPGYLAGAEGGNATAGMQFNMNAYIKYLKNFMSGSGSAVLGYAEQFRGRVPYVWGGATPGGWDCSGFVSYVLKHFGLLGARTDAQGLQDWARPAGIAPGNLAFYGRPAHHVGFVVNGSTLLSALGTRYGTIHSNLQMGDNSGYGVPPQGWGKAGGGFTTGAKIQELAYSMLQARGWGVQWPAFNSLENREAGWNMYARNPSSGAYGLAQFINGPGEYYQYGGSPNSASGQLTAMMNYIRQRYENPNNAWAHEIAYNWYGKGGEHGGGWAVVGEHGKELVKMPGGSRVWPSGQVPYGIGGTGAGTGGKLSLEIAPGASSDFDQFMVMMIRKWVVIKGGGNVQTAFGRR